MAFNVALSRLGFSNLFFLSVEFKNVDYIHFGSTIVGISRDQSIPVVIVMRNLPLYPAKYSLPFKYIKVVVSTSLPYTPKWSSTPKIFTTYIRYFDRPCRDMLKEMTLLPEF